MDCFINSLQVILADWNEEKSTWVLRLACGMPGANSFNTSNMFEDKCKSGAEIGYLNLCVGAVAGLPLHITEFTVEHVKHLRYC